MLADLREALEKLDRIDEVVADLGDYTRRAVGREAVITLRRMLTGELREAEQLLLLKHATPALNQES